MSLVPAGKTRVMVAQNFSDPLSEGASLDPISEQGSGPLSQTLEAPEAPQEQSPPPAETPTPSPKKKKTLTNYVFEKLESYGYPGRRLEEFKKKFVRESVSPEGIKDVQVEIPDKKYPGPDGFADTIENSDLKEIANEVAQHFGLNFNGAERSDGKWTIKFTSERISNPEEEEAGLMRDNLDEVYGKPAGGTNDPAQKRVAKTHRELIKEAKEEFVKQYLHKIYGEEHDTKNVRSTQD